MKLDNEKILLQNNQEDIQIANTTILKWLLRVGILSFIVLFILTFFIPSYLTMRIPYGIILIILIAVLALGNLPKVSSFGLLYFSYTILIAIVIFTSSFITPNSASALAIILLFQIPLVIIDKSWRVSLFTITFMLLYIIFMYLFKDSSLFIDEIINISITGIISLVLGNYLRMAQINSFELKRQAVIRENTDTLTGLYNRRKLFDTLIELENQKETINILMVDIDNFKIYNDTYGHQAGDICLKKVGHILHSFAPTVTFYRYGGEEFIGIIEGQDQANILNTSKQIVETIAAAAIPHLKSELAYVTISVGVAIGQNERTNSYEQLLFAADQALYEAKRLGKNQVICNK